jgi:glycosyltransferase involved in cell wall biosynthesis
VRIGCGFHSDRRHCRSGDDGETGLIVPPRDIAALGAAMEQLRDDAALRQRLGAAGHTRANRDFGLDRMLDRMEATFRAVLETR